MKSQRTAKASSGNVPPSSGMGEVTLSQVIVKIPKKLKKKFKDYCNANDTNQTQVLTEYIEGLCG